ncbi:MAG: metallophosphoesterase [candidate division FCPU426 bacterium]
MRRIVAAVMIVAVMLAAQVARAAGPWKFIMYGDTRTDDAAHRGVLTAITTTSQDYRFLINVGDVVEDGTRTDLWNVWQQACDDILGGTGQLLVPPKYMSAAGNHDALASPAGLANWTAYLPGQAAQFGNDGRFFFFDYENARFVILNNYESLSGPQYALLLQAIQTNPHPWLFAVWHQPIFDFGPKIYEGTIHTTWGVPLYQNGCDIIFAGHAHYYVRTLKLGLDGTLNPPLDASAGTAQIVTGNGGAPLVAVDENHDGNGYMVAYSYDQSQTGYYGYTELEINGASMTLRHIRASDSAVMDTAVYTANPKPTPFTPTSTPTATVQATPTSVAGWPDRITAYPNPARAAVTFSWNAPGISRVKIKILNAAGERVTEISRDQPGTDIAWASRGLAPGIYFYSAVLTRNGEEKAYPLQKIAIAP